MKVKKLAQMIALIGVASPVFAQVAEPAAPIQRVEITGSSIKRLASEGALPVQIITRKEMEAAGIATAEQLVANLNINGTGADNLASNADVASGAQRGNNGASSANLRGQGAGSTLVLLNGRRIATHGMKGQAVDLNSIPFAAVERVEVLVDGASSLYGTDAIGGVLNFILRKDYAGLEAQAFRDQTQQGGGNISRVSTVGGFGDVDKDGYNVLVAVAHGENQRLRGDQRDFVNTFQPDRGLSVDTRGTPYATVFATSLGDTVLSRSSNTGPALPGGTQTFNGINPLNLPGAAGCKSIDGMDRYDAKLWDSPQAAYGCAWDTGRAAVLQQEVKNTNALARGSAKFGQHEAYVELVGSQVDTLKSFSPNQISPNASRFPASSFYPSTGAAYNQVFNSLVAVFPSIEANRGLPIAYRWRCMECGNREIATRTDAGRALIAAQGPLGGWDYRVGLSTAYSKSQSTLGSGYNYTAQLASALGTGIINPFLPAGQEQSQAAKDLIASTSAKGITLYGGKTTTTEIDAALTGELFKLPAGAVMAAFGVDGRKESYVFNGDEASATAGRAILNAPFDSQNALPSVSRHISAVYAEFLLPITKELELTLSGRADQYSGFGRTYNPKASFRYAPLKTLMFRGSYSTGFRVPSFNQLFNGVTDEAYVGKDLADPGTCPTLKVDSTKPGCDAINPNILSGGKSDLGPEKSKQASVGLVWEPGNFSMNLDLWEIRKTDVISSLDEQTLLANYDLFKSSFIRDTSGKLIFIDERWLNSGDEITRGLEVGLRTHGKAMGGKWSSGIEGSYLLKKVERPLPNAPFGPSEVGVYSIIGDLGLRWKHTAYVSFASGPWSTVLQNVYRSGYADQVLPGVASGIVTPSNYNPNVKAYSIFNASVSYTGIKNLTLTAGVKNLLNTDPPFSVTYDSNSGAGSSWEPRVADPRGRSFTLRANYKFL